MWDLILTKTVSQCWKLNGKGEMSQGRNLGEVLQDVCEHTECIVALTYLQGQRKTGFVAAGGVR